MKIYLILIAIFAGWIAAFSSVPGLESPSPSHSQAGGFFDSLAKFTQKKNYGAVYESLSDGLKRNLEEAAFIRGLNENWMIIDISVLNIVEYSDYRVAVVRLDQSGPSSKKSRNIIPVFLVEEDGDLRLIHFPFSLSGAPGIVLREPFLTVSK